MERIEKKMFSSLPDKVNTSFESLPEHVIQRIQNYFSSPELNIKNLCETWSSVSDHPLLWLKLGFRGNVTSAQTICRILQNSPLLESIRLVNVPDIVSILQQLCRCCKQLKHLRVCFCCTGENLQSVPEASLRNIIYSCPNLISLDLKGTSFFGEKFYQELAYLRRLRALKLGCNSHLCSQDLFTIATVCRGRLKHLSILHSVHGIAPPSRAVCSQEALKTLIKQDSPGPFSKFSNESLRYNPQVLTTQEFSFLIKMLGVGLVSLELEVTVVDANAFHLICDLCTNLRSLRLINAMNLPGVVVQQIPTAMPHLNHLAIRRAYLPTEGDLIQLLLSDRKDKLSDSDGMECSTVSTIDSSVETNWWEGGFPSDDNNSESEESQADGDEMIWKGVSESLSPLLSSLELNMCMAVSDLVLEVLTEGYLVNTLHTLSIRGCQRVTPKGLDLLPKCFKLRYLDVSFVDLKRGPTTEWLNRVPMSMPNLDTLVVGFWEENAKKKEAMKEIKRVKPSLQIKNCISLYYSKEENFC